MLHLLKSQVARVVTCTRKFDSIVPARRELHWLSIQSRITYKVALLICKALQTCQPEYSTSLLYSEMKLLASYDRQLVIVLEVYELYVRQSNFRLRSSRNLEQTSGRRYWAMDPGKMKSVTCFETHLKTYFGQIIVLQITFTWLSSIRFED